MGNGRKDFQIGFGYHRGYHQSKAHRGEPVRSAYEGIRIAPESPLLQDLDKEKFVFPTSH